MIGMMDGRKWPTKKAAPTNCPSGLNLQLPEMPIGHQDLFILRPKPARPTNEKPTSAREAGSGTAAAAPGMTKEILLFGLPSSSMAFCSFQNRPVSTL